MIYVYYVIYAYYVTYVYTVQWYLYNIYIYYYYYDNNNNSSNMYIQYIYIINYNIYLGMDLNLCPGTCTKRSSLPPFRSRTYGRVTRTCAFAENAGRWRSGTFFTMSTRRFWAPEKTIAR